MSEELEPLPDSQVYVLDSHIPYDLDNIYDGDVVKVVIPESFDLEVGRSTISHEKLLPRPCRVFHESQR